MNSRYNVLINYLGENTFKFVLKKVGEISISKDKPVYVYGADIETINHLRTLRRMLIEIKIGAKPEGAYKIYNMENIDREKERLKDTRVEYDRRGYETVSSNDIKSILSSGTNGPIEIEATKIKSISGVDNDEDIKGDIVDEVKVVEPKKEEKQKTTKKRGTRKKNTK